jgi:uncharacterized protein YyaL (SSP411 family)
VRRRLSVFALALLLPGVVCSSSQDRPPGTNRLIHESSPYLLQHARNPVDWYPWGEEAIELARRLDRPIFLSIGYSTCYWCHRMEEDVFEDPEIAALMNEGFINIKVDREERPDLDEIYMTAAQLLTRGGGWPNNLFLTPDLKPFVAGTYFPPEDREGAVGFPTVLRRVSELWRTDRAKIEEAAAGVAERLEGVIASGNEAAVEVPAAGAASAAFRALARSFDEDWGGFGTSPKFPAPPSLFLLHSLAREGNEQALSMLLRTLRRMGEGALYDHLEGGFHRYTTDREWRMPHFEKMLYDNAALAEILVETFALTRDPALERFARGTLDFVLEKLTGPSGGFLSAIDAQSEGREGAYYVWSREQIESMLSPSELEIFAPAFGLDRAPNFEGREHTLYLASPAAADRLPELEGALEKLRRARASRPHPPIDDKVLADWNGLTIAAMAKAGTVFREPRYERAAERAAAFLLEELMSEEGALFHVWRGGRARVEGFLEDYAFVARGLLVLHRESGDERWLREAERLAEEMEKRLRDPRGGYYQSREKPYLLVQSKPANDGATASGNGIAASVLLELFELTGKDAYRERAASALRAFASDLDRYPEGASTLALAVERYHAGAPAPLDALAASVVDARIEPSSMGSTGFRLTLKVKGGWHINANPASSPYLIPTEVKGALRNVSYPPGKSRTFAFSDEPLLVYDGELAIEGEWSSPPTPLTLVYQPCDETRCLPPVTRVLATDNR